MDQNPETNLPAPSQNYRFLIWVLAALAIGLRVYQYLRNPAVWCDELWLLRNITGKSFAELLGPLVDAQAAPPLFLWTERVVWLTFGDNIFAMRFLSLFSSCCSVLLFVPLARRCAQSGAVIWAIVLFGFCDAMTRYTCDVKPYTTDTLLAIGLPLLFFATQRWSLEFRLALFTLLAPVAIFLSYPACFVYGALILALLPSLYENRQRWQAWLGAATMVLTTLAVFTVLYFGPIRAQRNADLNVCWVDFPDWRQPWNVPLWSLDAVNRLFEHFWRPTGSLLMAPAVIGAISMWRRQARLEVFVLVLPLALAMLASWIRAYPFESRLLLFVMPSLALLAGEGFASLSRWSMPYLTRCYQAKNALIRFGAVGCIVVLFVLPLLHLGHTVYYVIYPMPRLTIETWPEPRNGT